MNCYFLYFQSLHLAAHKTFLLFFHVKTRWFLPEVTLIILLRKNTTLINYFEDRMPNIYFRLNEVPVREKITTITRQTLILCIIIGESKEFLFIHHIYQTLLILYIITGYYSKSLIKRLLFSIMHNSREMCILPNFSHLP